MAVFLTQKLAGTLMVQAQREYPDECCGVLMGRRGTGIRIERVMPAENIADGDRRTAYQVDWRTLFAATRAARSGPDQIAGFYHSHPDGSNEPSDRDTRAAWVDFVYVIVPIVNGRCANVTGWRIPEEGSVFQPEPIVFLESPDGQREPAC